MRMFIPIVEVAPSEKTGTGQNSMAKTGQFWVAINISFPSLLVKASNKVFYYSL